MVDIKVLGLTLCMVILPSADAQNTCSRPAEVVFLIDTSSSIWEVDFKKELAFVKNIVGMFDVSPTTTRIAVVTFSRGYKHEFGLKAYTTVQTVQQAVERITHTAGDSTDTGMAIRYARDQILGSARSTVPRIIICITDGASTNKALTIQEANKTRSAGILLFAVGVGSTVNMNELYNMATRQTTEYVFTVSSFDRLDHIKTLLSLAACKATLAPPVITTTTTTTTTTTEIIPNDATVAQKVCGGKPADVVFVLDRSNSVWIEDFKLQLRVVQDIVRVFDIGADKTQIAAVSFSTNVSVEFYLNEFRSKDDIIARIGKTIYSGGVTETGQALKVVRDAVLSPGRGSRSWVDKIVVVITDGRSQDTEFTKQSALLLKNDKVHLFAIGVGNETDVQELEYIASTPASDYVFQIDGYQALNAIKYILAIKACDS